MHMKIKCSSENANKLFSFMKNVLMTMQLVWFTESMNITLTHQYPSGASTVSKCIVSNVRLFNHKFRETHINPIDFCVFKTKRMCTTDCVYSGGRHIICNLR